MYYNIVEIRPIEGRWRVSWGQVARDRQGQKEYKPNGGLGFFYYPRRWGHIKGFKVLQNAMIKRREQEIAEIQRDIDDLKALKLH